jgi:hypothetical protein
MDQHETPPPPPPYDAQHAAAGPEAPGATAGLVLGILSIVFSGPIIGLIFGIIGLMKSREAKAFCEMHPDSPSAGIAQAGFICSIIGTCISALTTLCGCGYFIVVVLALGGAAASGG